MMEPHLSEREELLRRIWQEESSVATKKVTEGEYEDLEMSEKQKEILVRLYSEHVATKATAEKAANTLVDAVTMMGGENCRIKSDGNGSLALERPKES
jgi:ribonuclease HII